MHFNCLYFENSRIIIVKWKPKAKPTSCLFMSVIESNFFHVEKVVNQFDWRYLDQELQEKNMQVF